MSDTPLVSVIVAAFNAQDYIAETIDSILDQTYKNIEVIVVDDGSKDNTSLILKKYGNKIRHYYHNNKGSCSYPRNFGLEKSRGDLVCFFDADDIMKRIKIESQVGFIESNTEVGLVFIDYINFKKNILEKFSHFNTCSDFSELLKDRSEVILENPCELLAKENFGITGTFMARRKFLEEEGGFNTELKACEDFHLYYRLARRTKVGVVNRVGMLRRLHDNNLSGNSYRMAVDGIKSYGLLRESETNPVARMLLDRYIASCWADLSRIRADRGEYLQAFSAEAKALHTDFCPHRLCAAMRSFARTVAMAAGLHTPRQARE